MNSLDKLNDLRVDLDQYYETTFDTDEADRKANQLLKSRIGDLIIAAHALGDSNTVKQALELLSESTGCAEYYEIFTNITDELVIKNIITNDDVKKYLEKSPVNRWF